MVTVSVVLMGESLGTETVYIVLYTNGTLCTTRTVTTIQPKDIHADSSLVLDLR